jgi:hypothetical protein
LWAYPEGGKEIISTGKIVVNTKMEIPQTIMEVGRFLPLTNYYSCYVHIYSTFSSPLMENLQLGREEGKKGSLKAVAWDDTCRLAFENLKIALKEGLEVFQIEPDHSFNLRSDASNFALGAVLEQQRKDKWVPVAFYSRKLTKGQKIGRPGKNKNMPSSRHFENGQSGSDFSQLWSKPTFVP